MRWADPSLGDDDGALPGLGRAGLVRTVCLPESGGTLYREVLCASALSRVPEGSGLPFRWSADPYRASVHRCRYCLGGPVRAHVDTAAGARDPAVGDPTAGGSGTEYAAGVGVGEKSVDEVAVALNAAAVLRRELARRSWRREPVGVGVEADPYEAAEGHYRLMPGIIGALAGSATPTSIHTRSPLLQRDLPLLSAAARRVEVDLAVSLATTDRELHAAVEPSAPAPADRLELIGAIRAAGFAPHVTVAPVMPYLSDGRGELDGIVAAVAEAGAGSVTVVPMRLCAATRGWLFGWLGENHPKLVGRYRRLYGRGDSVPVEYRVRLRERIALLREKHGLAGGPGTFRAGSAGSARRQPAAGGYAPGRWAAGSTWPGRAAVPVASGVGVGQSGIGEGARPARPMVPAAPTLF